MCEPHGKTAGLAIIICMSATKTETMPRVTFGDRVIRLVFWSRRMHRLLYPSPAEVQFVRVMRGHALTLPLIKSTKTGFPLTLLWRGKLLKNELIEREVWAGGERRFCMDFATPHAAYRKAIEIDGSQHDILKDQERDEYLRAHGWTVLHVKARRLWREPRLVFVDVCKFLKS
jgi:very-short-patch-repair endonuclease